MYMKTIMLACAAGMSTSLLVTKMTESGKRRNIEVEIFAKSVSELDQVLAEKKVDVLLLGPQVGFMKKEITDKLVPYGIPVEVINMSDYGMMNGEKVLNAALETIND
ncbi:MAG TPA: PTS sugar transporter subunit IIB [Sporosarcina psychrophila]|uniref:PTS sugar transporter subunit IIB n=1 Tax=Sporosarcina psychrophila TaxID=1476 RepID=A0A921KF98_SPOPS|nr:PTS sugar transporter subunit IIB [Sporosarcina psychrophila]